MTKQAGNLIKHAAEARAKRLGLAASNVLTDNSSKTDASKKIFNKITNKPFWLWNKDQDKQEFDKHNGACCFNHVVGLPEKNGILHPLYPFQKEVIDNLEKYRRLYVLKASAIGITTLLLRYIVYRCLFDDSWKGKNVVIVTSPRQELSIDLMRRIRALFPTIYFDTKETVLELNGVRIEAFPSHNTRSLRGIKDCIFVLADEAAFWNQGFESDEARTVIERMIPKSNPYIALVSTPNRPGDLMEKIRDEPDEVCLYKRMYLDYRVGINTIFTDQELTQMRKSVSWDREMCLKFLGATGNVLAPVTIEKMIEKGKKYDPDQSVPFSRKAMGVDAGWASSKFGVTVVRMTNKLEVLYSEEFANATFDQMINRLLNLKRALYVDRIYVDMSNSVVIRSLKEHLSERTDYQKHIEELRKSHFAGGDNNDYLLCYWMSVIPVNFGAGGGSRLLEHMKELAEMNAIAINPRFTKLITSLRSATAIEMKLDKDVTAHNDILDSFLLVLEYFKMVPPVQNFD